MANESPVQRFVYPLVILSSFIISPNFASYDQLRKNGLSQHQQQQQQPSGSGKLSNYCNDDNPQPHQQHVHCPVGKGSNLMCSGHGECNCSHGFCHCFPDWTGPSCEYRTSILNCDSLRSCVQCRVHGTGPFADDNGCEYFCKDYPPVIPVDTFYVQNHETLCSYIDDSSNRCRYLFKVVNFPSLKKRTSKLGGNADVYVIAKLSKDCDSKPSNNLKHFPLSAKNERENRTIHNGMISSQQIMEQIREEEEEAKQNDLKHYVTPIILMLIIVLPTTACVLSCMFNLPSLPCGLCNKFRRPSSAYLRNVRPYPGGPIEAENNIFVNDL